MTRPNKKVHNALGSNLTFAQRYQTFKLQIPVDFRGSGILCTVVPVKALFKDMYSKHGLAAIVEVFFFVFFCHGHLILLIPTLLAL